MNEINGSRYVNVPYYPCAADECEMILRGMGFRVQLKRVRGSHSAEIYVPKEERSRFDEQILRKTIIGKNRKFFMGEGEYFGVHYYYVNYLKK